MSIYPNKHPLTPEGSGTRRYSRGELGGARPILIIEACDILSQRIRRIDRQMYKLRLDKSSPKYVTLANHKARLMSKLIGLAELHYEGRTYIPSSISRAGVRKN